MHKSLLPLSSQKSARLPRSGLPRPLDARAIVSHHSWMIAQPVRSFSGRPAMAPLSRADRGHSGSVRPQCDLLEPRTLCANFLVINTNDAGIGSLRQAILNANATNAADTVKFAI